MNTGTLRVPGAALHYQVQGAGPVLLISESGEGDADRSRDLVARLADDHTVITYDRRGLTRSTLDDPAAGVTVAQHADDVHRLLAHLTDQPVTMLGLSLGASIGLHLATRHPGQLGTLLAHEPVSPWLLPPAQARHHRAELAAVQETYRRDGPAAVFREVAKVLGIDPANQDTEPGITPQPLTRQRTANFGFFVEHDFTAVIRDELDFTPPAGVRVVPLIGRTTPPAVFDHRCARELAKLLGTDPVEFPGGHNGNLTHPAAYATRLREVLTGLEVTPS